MVTAMQNRDTMKPRKVLTLSEAELKQVLQRHFRRFVSDVTVERSETGEVQTRVEFTEHPPTTY